MEFAYDGGGLGKGGTVTLYVDGEQVGQGRVERTHKFFFSMDETADIGSDAGAPVSEDYGPRGNRFTARSAGSKSTSTRPPKTSTISSMPRNDSTSRWPSSRPTALASSPGVRRHKL
jgi:hypothetical protein